MSEFVAPGLHVVTVNFYDTRSSPDARPEFLVRTCHVPTPETHGSTHYFVVHSRDFAVDDAAVTEFMHAELFRAFEEDVVALTRLEEVLVNPGAPFYEMSIASDAPSVAMRRYLLKHALAEQGARSPAVAADAR
jgi:vanillate O-demethylase monooxygenase subunit